MTITAKDRLGVPSSSKNVAQPWAQPPLGGRAIDIIITRVREREREATIFRKNGQLQAAIIKYCAAVAICDDAYRKTHGSPMAEVWNEKKMSLQKELNAVVATHECMPLAQPTRQPPLSPTAVVSLTLPKPLPVGGFVSRHETASALLGRTVGSRELNFDKAMCNEDAGFSTSMKDESDIARVSAGASDGDDIRNTPRNKDSAAAALRRPIEPQDAPDGLHAENAGGCAEPEEGSDDDWIRL